MFGKRSILKDTIGKVLKTSTPQRDPGAMSGILTGVSFIGGVGGANALADSPYPRPGSEPEKVKEYFTSHARNARLSAAGQLISAASLARFTTSVVKLADRSGEGSQGLRTAAIAGGGLAAASLATSASCAAALSGRGGKQESSAAALHKWGFIAGGPVHGPGYGLLVGSLGLAGLRTGELPTPLAYAALGAAAANLLSPLYLIAEPAGWLIPVGRFPGLVIVGIAGARLARRSG